MPGPKVPRVLVRRLGSVSEQQPESPESHDSPFDGSDEFDQIIAEESDRDPDLAVIEAEPHPARPGRTAPG